jgi:uncharacterized protein (DUF885 family)
VIQQSNAIITGAPFTRQEPGDEPVADSAIWADMKQEIAALIDAAEITQPQADALLANARLALLEDFQPAYQRIINWAEAEQDKVPSQSTGIGNQPDGVAYYQYRLANQTTTDLSAADIHQIGLDEVARIRGEMTLIMQEVDFTGDLDSFLMTAARPIWTTLLRLLRH